MAENLGREKNGKQLNGDKLVRRTGYLAVLAVSGVAALISYWHAVAVVGKHGEPGVYGHLYPATIDGLIIAASMVLLDSARNHEKPPRLAWWLVGAGIAGTLGANILDGVSYGFLGSIIAAWPAAAFVGAYEMIMVLIRSGARHARAQEVETVPTVAIELPEAEQPKMPPGWAPWMQPQVFQEKPRPPQEIPALPEPGPSDTQEVPVLADGAPPAANDASSYAGQVNVRSPLSRLDRKIPADIRQTGSFPAIRE
jgi:hypothetical protein